MGKSVFEMMDSLVSRINAQGCRVTVPYAEPSPLTVMYDGEFSGAEYIPSYPATLHIFGINGHVAVNTINSVEQVRNDRFVVNFGDSSRPCDMLVRISE